MSTSKALKGLILAVSLPGLTHAADKPPEFSAKVVQKGPSQPQVEWRIYRGNISGNQAVRTESDHGGRTWARITLPEEGRQIMMDLDQKTYGERSLPSAPSQASKTQSEPAKGPCQGERRSRCKKLGEEKVRDRKAVKWQVMRFRPNGPARWLVWLDQERDYTLRRVGPNGSYMEQWLAADDVTINGRKTEKWKTVISHPNGRTLRSIRWFDPELGMAIKEKQPDGSVRKLKEIDVTEQPDKLFRIPDGFEPAFPGPGQAGQASRQPVAGQE